MEDWFYIDVSILGYFTGDRSGLLKLRWGYNSEIKIVFKEVMFMTKAKKLPVLSPSIHTFEMKGTYTNYEVKAQIFDSIKKRLSEGKYYQVHYGDMPKNYYIYKRNDGGLTIILSSCPEYKKNYITLSGVNLARIAGEPSRLALTELSPHGLACQEEIFLNELESLGILDMENSITWKMKRVDITQDFYIKSDPTLPMKVIRYAGKVKPHGKGREEHHDQHNEIRSCTFIKEKYNFELYDKHEQLLSCADKGDEIQPEDIELSRNLVRYEIQLNRHYLKDFEHKNLKDKEFTLKDHVLYAYFAELGRVIPALLYKYAYKMFGAHPWYHASGALERLEKSELDKKTKKLVRSYIEAWNESGKPVKCSYRKKEQIEEALDVLEINTVIIPDQILNKRQYARFPVAPIYSRVQGVDKMWQNEPDL